MKQDFACEEVDGCKSSEYRAFLMKALSWRETEVCTIKNGWNAEGKQLAGAKAVWTLLHCALPVSGVSTDRQGVEYAVKQDFSKGIVFLAQVAR